MPSYKSGGNPPPQKNYKLPLAVQNYLDEPTGEGSRNDRLLAVAAQLRDDAWSEHEAVMILMDRSLSNGLPEHEIRTTIRSAFSKPPRPAPCNPHTGKASTGGDGYSLNFPLHRPHPEPQPKVQAASYTVAPDAKLPAEIPNGTKVFLEKVFREGDMIQLVYARNDKDDKEMPDFQSVGHAKTQSREDWLNVLEEAFGVPLYFFTDNLKEPHGIYTSINPFKTARKAAEITDLRYALLEFDGLPLGEQWQVIEQSKVPCVTVTTSGGKSIHALVKIMAATPEQYKERIETMHAHFALYKPDTKCKDPSRLSRLPGGIRGDPKFKGNHQNLIAVDIGLATWEEWESAIEEAQSGLPLFQDASALIKEPPPEPEEVIEGLLHRTCKMVVGGGSKSFKTWCLMDLALSVATGREWWGMPVNEGKVLYLNLELHRAFFVKRLAAIMKAKGIYGVAPGMLTVHNLRGFCADIDKLKAANLKMIGTQRFVLIIIDPIYKVLGGRDENSAGDIGTMLNSIESIAVASGAAIAFGAHFSKGNQALKEAMDRIGGSGVYARDPDAIVTMTMHESEGAFTINTILRNHAPMQPFVVRWQFPLMVKDAGLDPDAVKQPKTPGGKKKTAVTMDEFLTLFSDNWQPGKIREACIGVTQLRNMFIEAGWGRDQADRLREDAKQMRKLAELRAPKDNAIWIGKPHVIAALRKEIHDEMEAYKAAQKKKNTPV